MSEREQFEGAARSKLGDDDGWFIRGALGDYASEDVQSMWEGWQIARAQPSPITSETGNQADQGASAITSGTVPLLTDAEIIEEAAWHLGPTNVENCGLGDIKDFARAVESLVRSKLGAGVPMTHAERTAALVEQYPDNDCPHMWSFLDGIRAAERHHGIVGKEGGK